MLKKFWDAYINPDDISSFSCTSILWTRYTDIVFKSGEKASYKWTDVYDDLVVTMTNIKPPASLYPTYRAYKQSQVPAFSDTSVNVLYFSAQVPHSYKEGGDLEFHIHLA